MRLGHVILTRYNIAFWDKQSQTAWRATEWLEDRVRLFSSYTFPSLAGQESRAFTWLVFIHPDSPAWLKQRLEKDRGAANMRLIEAPFFDPKLAAAIAREQVDSTVTHLVTTTLDNDDALARSFVGEVQRHVRDVDFEMLNFSNGFRLIERTGSVYHCRILGNPFISAVERLGQARTIWGYLPHGTILERVKAVRDIATAPLWLQVVHGRNLAATDAWGLEVARSSEVKARFSLSGNVNLNDRPAVRLWMENIRRSMERIAINCLSSRMRSRLKKRLRPRRRRWGESFTHAPVISRVNPGISISEAVSETSGTRQSDTEGNAG